MNKLFKKITVAAMAGVIAMCISVTANAEHNKPGTKIPCTNTHYTLGHHSKVSESKGTHNYTCTVTYYTYRHSKWCSSCEASLGEGPTYRCTESHTCSGTIKDCTGVF